MKFGLFVFYQLSLNYQIWINIWAANETNITASQEGVPLMRRWSCIDFQNRWIWKLD